MEMHGEDSLLKPPSRNQSETSMNTDQIQGNWNILKGRIKQAYGQLADDDLTRTEGNLDEIAGLIQRSVGKTREEAKRELEELAKSI